MRDLMISRMREEIKNPNGCSRYGRFFYRLKEPLTKRERKFNAKAIEDSRFNIDTLEDLDDETLFLAYNRFCMRYSTWM